MNLNTEQAEVVRLLTDGTFANAIVDALPGTGKTTIGHEIARRIENTKGCAMLTCATTGVATTGMPDIIIGSHRSPARTVNSLIIDRSLIELMKNLPGPLHAVTFIVDEVMMCDQKVFSGLVEFSDTLKTELAKSRGRSPRVQYILLGDPSQLPAVKCSFLLWTALERFLETNAFHFLKLTTPERMKHCEDLVQLADMISKRNPRFSLMLRAFQVSGSRPPHPPGCGSIYLSYLRADCEKHNNRAYDIAQAAGARCTIFVHNITNEVVMRLAEGIRIIMKKNTRDPEDPGGSFLYVNGDIGTFESAAGTDACSQKLLDMYGSVRTRFLFIDKHLEVRVILKRHKDSDKITTVTPRGCRETIGGKLRKSHVLMLNAGEGITIHNAQGMTINGDLTVNLNNLPMYEGIGLNLLHVALTRGVSGSGLRIVPWGSYSNGEDMDDVETARALCEAPVSEGVQRYYNIVKRLKRA